MTSSSSASIMMDTIGDNNKTYRHHPRSSNILFVKSSSNLIMIINILIFMVMIAYPLPKVAFCLPENNVILINDAQQNETVFSKSLTKNVEANFGDNHYLQRSKREVFVFTTSIPIYGYNDHLESAHIPRHRVPRMHKPLTTLSLSSEYNDNNNHDNDDNHGSKNNSLNEKLSPQDIDNMEPCQSKMCFRKVAEFDPFLKKYNTDLSKMTEVECLLRKMFFTCLRNESVDQQCNKKRFKKYRQRIAAFLWNTRSCIKY